MENIQSILLALGVWGILCGGIGVISSFMMRGKWITVGAVLAIIFGVLGLFTVQGLLIGPILILIGGIIGVIKR
ncbi:MAG: hypothetical protein GWO20_13745 [Candidatus Korarchaeota archaeon]|nr:hypothetical protein [Candidatus Korarchaeota archaeon]NIU84474.1 hypothetical protein [Candidatus Thorarchaeota archaeon]NIW14550.1 hypothetical protein [Candidatus Thorarchaeota archaeon]NIW52623.1 hypothetical protein [Candidatus Korarchaeota archaeon]